MHGVKNSGDPGNGNNSVTRSAGAFLLAANCVLAVPPTPQPDTDIPKNRYISMSIPDTGDASTTDMGATASPHRAVIGIDF